MCHVEPADPGRRLRSGLGPGGGALASPLPSTCTPTPTGCTTRSSGSPESPGLQGAERASSVMNCSPSRTLLPVGGGSRGSPERGGTRGTSRRRPHHSVAGSDARPGGSAEPAPLFGVPSERGRSQGALPAVSYGDHADGIGRIPFDSVVDLVPVFALEIPAVALAFATDWCAHQVMPIGYPCYPLPDGGDHGRQETLFPLQPESRDSKEIGPGVTRPANSKHVGGPRPPVDPGTIPSPHRRAR